jgi:hypothetical protein
LSLAAAPTSADLVETEDSEKRCSMISTLSSIMGALIVGGVIIAMIAAVAANRLPVRFRSFYELNEIYGVARWAAKELALTEGDTRLFHSLNLFVYSLYGYWASSIPIEELALLAPFIDRIIDGKGPLLNLPMEYEVQRRETLQRFKRRMEAGGLWPQSQS